MFSFKPHQNLCIQASIFFFDKLDKRKIITEIQQVVLDNIYCMKENSNKKKSYQDLIQYLKQTKDVNITS
jgi:hypothetical protein